MKQLFPRGKRIRPTDKDLVFHTALPEIRTGISGTPETDLCRKAREAGKGISGTAHHGSKE